MKQDHQLKMDVFDRELAENQIVEEQKTISYETKEYTVELLVQKLRSQEYRIPDYQREFVWEKPRQSRFIESMIMGLPIPFLFAADIERTGLLEIVDGTQRLRTLRAFLDGELELEKLKKLELINGYKFADLPLSQQRRFLNRTIRMIVLFEQTDFHTRFEIFERINTGSQNVRPAEIRKGAFGGKYYDMVIELASLPLFLELCPVRKGREPRGEPEELVLRFLAYSESYQEFSHDVRYFLDNFLIKKNREAAKDASLVQRSRADFERMLAFIKGHFPYGFAKGHDVHTTPRVRFEALSVGSHLALQKRPSLRVTDVSWIDSREFKDCTRSEASNSRPRLAKRIEYVRDILLKTDESART